MRSLNLIFGTILMLGATCTANASVVTIPNSALIPSDKYYTDIIGGGIGSPLIMTGGDHVGESPNDDGFSGPINLGYSLSFFNATYTKFYANNNGNISFNHGIEEYTPDGPQGAPEPIISPFFADVDTQNFASGLMYLRNDIPNQTIITWDHVGYFDARADKLNSFQLVLRGPDYQIPNGEGSTGFFYKDMQWETGEASGGEDGFGGTPAAVGFGNGENDGKVLEGSIQDGISGIVNNHHIWFDAKLAPVTAPEPISSTLFLVGSCAFGWSGYRRRRCKTVNL